MTKPKLFLDMDNVLVDTLPVLNELAAMGDMHRPPDQVPGIFKKLPALPGAVAGVKLLSQDYDLYILSTAPWLNPSAWQDKLVWLKAHFGQTEANPFYKKVILTHDKGLVHFSGGLLIDDRPYHGASDWLDNKANSSWIQYGYDEALTWNGQLVPFLRDLAQILKTQTTNLPAALTKANQTGFQLHGDRTSFTQMSWEKNIRSSKQ